MPRNVRITIDTPHSSTSCLDTPQSEEVRASYPPPHHEESSPKEETHQPGPSKLTQAAAESQNVVIRVYEAFLKPLISWSFPYLNWRSFRPVVRSVISALIGLILLVNDNSFKALGNLPPFLLVVAMISPPCETVAQHLERNLASILMVGCAWAYSAIGLRISWIVRRNTPLQDAAAFASYLSANGLTVQDAFDGRWLDTRCSVVCAVWLSVGFGFLAWFKSVVGPGPFVSGVVFSNVVIAITFANAQFYPYPNYFYPWTFVRPCFAQLAVSTVCSLMIFPESVPHLFSQQLSSVLSHLGVILSRQKEMLSYAPSKTAWDDAAFNLDNPFSAAGVEVGKLAMTEHAFNREVSFGRWDGRELKKLITEVRTLVARTNNFLLFQNIVTVRTRKGDPKSEAEGLTIRLLGSKTRSRSNANVVVATGESERGGEAEEGRLASARSSMYRDKDGEGHHHHQRISGTTSRGSLTFLRGLWTSHRHHPRVGVIESQRYMDLEEALKNAADEVNLDELVELLKTSTATLVASLEKGVKRLIEVSAQLRSIGINPFRKRYNHEEELRRSEELLDQVKVALDDFRTTGRLKILEPYHYLFDPTATEKDGDFTVPSHRGIYLAYLYEYGLIRWSESFVSLFEKVLEVEKKGKHRRLSLPRLKKKLFTTHLSGDTVEDEDPNHVPGLQPTFITARRDPDTLPPRHLGQHIGHAIYRASLTITQREVVFGIKVAALVALVSLPAYLRASATFFNEQRGLWALILAATSAGQFVGDTVYAFCQRIISTFLGAVFGLAIWYTGCGSGQGNSYGIVAAAALYFVPVFYYRVYFPVPTTSVLGVITTALVVGYSWLDGQHPENNFNGTNFGVGWEIAWRRLLTVIIGVTAAFIWAYVPPSSTSKHFMRHGFGKIIQESGRHFCAVVSFLKHQSEPVSTVSPLLQHNWVALRSKIRNLNLSKSYINYELSIKGDWPEETYSELDRLSRSVLDIIQLFLDVTGTLPKTWRDALLNRVRFSDPCFISDITSVFYELSTSLNIGTPLPQFYNPLFEALVHIQYGFALVPWVVVFSVYLAKMANRIELTPEGIPKHLDIETIQSMEYVKFSVATSYATAIVNRLDRLMFIVKTLCGEDYRMIGDEEHERLLTNENDSQDSLV